MPVVWRVHLFALRKHLLKTVQVGTRVQVMYYTESTRASYALYIVHDVNAGRGKVRAPGDAHKYLLPMSRLDKTHMKPD